MVLEKFRRPHGAGMECCSFMGNQGAPRLLQRVPITDASSGRRLPKDALKWPVPRGLAVSKATGGTAAALSEVGFGEGGGRSDTGHPPGGEKPTSRALTTAAQLTNESPPSQLGWERMETPVGNTSSRQAWALCRTILGM